VIRRRHLAPILILGIGACAAPAPEPASSTAEEVATRETEPEALPAEVDGWHTSVGGADLFRVSWKPLTEDAQVPKNVHFALEIVVADENGPVVGARVAVRGWMPEHGHGLVARPVVTEQGDGHYRAEGVLLHMRGSWDLIVDVVDRAGRTDSVTFGVEL